MRARRLLACLLAAACATAHGDPQGMQGAPGAAGDWQAEPLAGLRGGQVALASLRDRPLLVNFWARWCVPCRAELPALAEAQRAHPGLRVVGVALDDDPSAVREFAAAYDASYLMLLARPPGIELLAAAGDPDGSLPFTVAVDAHGTVLLRHRGALDAAQLAGLLARLEGSRR